MNRNSPSLSDDRCEGSPPSCDARSTESSCEKVKGCVLSQAAGAEFVKTSTGFASGGATAEDVALMRQVVGREMGVKAAGGVRDLKSAQQMIAAGADRIGASVGVKIVQESQGRSPVAGTPSGY